MDKRLATGILAVDEVTHAWVTQASSGAKPSMWFFSTSSCFWDTNIGKEQFSTPRRLIFLLNQSCISSQMK